MYCLLKDVCIAIFFRSPSPHKCLLETSFCGSKPTLADNLIEPSKPETDDLEKILLKREADTTKALIPENIKVPIVGGNLKPDPLDKPRRRGREERKEIFKREVEITKRFLEKVNIEVGLLSSYLSFSKLLDISYREMSRSREIEFVTYNYIILSGLYSIGNYYIGNSINIVRVRHKHSNSLGMLQNLFSFSISLILLIEI